MFSTCGQLLPERVATPWTRPLTFCDLSKVSADPWPLGISWPGPGRPPRLSQITVPLWLRSGEKKKGRVIDTYIYISHFNICVIVASMRRFPRSCRFFSFFSFCVWRSSVARDFVGILFDNECKTIWLFHMAFSSSDRWGTAWLLAKTCTYVPACVRKANRILNFSNEAKTVILVLSRWAGRKFHSLCVQNL